MADNIIISSYLVIVLIIGFYKSLNIKSMREFSIADKNYSLPIMVATLTATAIGGGSTMGIISSIFTYGVVYIFISFGNPVNKFLTGQFFIEKLEQFNDCISVGDIMHKLYGKNARIISGICGSLYCAATVGAQVSAIGFVVHYFLNIPFLLGVIIGCGAVVLYSATGGIKAVTATDVIQFAVMLIAIPMVCNVGLTKVGGYSSLFERVPPEILRLPDNANAIINCLFIFLTFSLPSLDPPETQRLLMAKDRQQIRNTLYLTVLIEVVFFVLIGLIGLLAVAINPGHDANVALPHLVNTILPMGLKGIAVAGLLSVIMSTADSYLHSASICLVHDTIKPLYKGQISDQSELRLTQLTTLLLGTGALVLAVSFNSILGIVLFSANFWGPIMVLPLYAGLMGYKFSSKCFYSGMVCGVTTFLCWHFMLESQLGIQSFIPSMFMSTIGFFSMNYLERIRLLRTEC
jgi:SSS family solute:Na+ symporter